MRALVRLAALTIVLALLACSAPSRPAQPRSARNATVVALMPSFVDDLYAIGAGNQVLAVSAYTDVPQARRLPRVADFSSIDAERIVALRPSVVVGIPAQQRLVEPLRRAGLRVVLLPDDSYASIFANLRAIGALTGHKREAGATIERLQTETARLHAQTQAFKRRPRVFVVLGAEPIWTAGSASYIATLIQLAGGVNAASMRTAYGQYNPEALLHEQPDVLIADPQTHLEAFFDREPWHSLRAVTRHHVYAVNPDLIQRPGPSYNEGVRWLIARLEPLANSNP